MHRHTILDNEIVKPLLGADVDRCLAANDLAGPIRIGHHQPAHQRHKIPCLTDLILEDALDDGTDRARRVFHPLVSTFT